MIVIKPDEGYLYVYLGISYNLSGRYEEAIKTSGKPLKKGDGEKGVYNKLRLTLGRIQKCDEALEAIKIAGDGSKAANDLGFIYLNQGKYEKAFNRFEKSIELSPTFYDKARKNLKTAKTYLNSTR